MTDKQQPRDLFADVTRVFQTRRATQSVCKENGRLEIGKSTPQQHQHLSSSDRMDSERVEVVCNTMLLGVACIYYPPILLGEKKKLEGTAMNGSRQYTS